MSECRQLDALWLVSPDVPTRIDEAGQPREMAMLYSVAMACNSGARGRAVAKRIVADHNACLGIPDPVSTIPKLVAFANAHHEFPGFLVKGRSGPTAI